MAEQLNWELPDVIIYPTWRWHRADWNVESICRDGTDGLDRQQAAPDGDGASRRLRADCTTFADGKRFADEFPNAATAASGLRVPKAIGDFLILDALRDSGGTAVAVTDEELIAATREIGSLEGVFFAP